ncbi:MAG: DUF4249 domain-containing protein [Gemmatimonadota bacterium]|nr:DUF4249 domain-containing protein [Gemmatimonadota bacterium]
MRGRVSATLIAGCALIAAVACTFDVKAIAVPTSQVVVHGVLDPGDTLVDVLIERSLSGAITVRKGRYDPLDPINSGGGVPAKGAQVSITGPDGTTQGLEVIYSGKPSTYGAGRYVFRKLLVRPGKAYTLNVRTTDGIVVTGRTLVPNFVTPPFSTALIPFSRDRDTLKLKWNAVPNARVYGLRAESPFGAFQLFSDSTTLNLAGDLRNIFAGDLPRIFIPGFQQAVTIYAADTNFFDYYRSRNDPFTGSGIINRLDGGIGLFGATVVITSRTLDVTQPTTEPAFEGSYEFVQGSVQARTFVDIMRLYVETPATPMQGASLSGWYSRDRKFTARDGIAGTRDGDRIVLQFLVNQNTQSRLVSFTGKQSNDSLIGNYSGVPGIVAFRKRPTP